MAHRYRYRNFNFEQFLMRQIREADAQTLAFVESKSGKDFRDLERLMEDTTLDEKFQLFALLGQYVTMTHHGMGRVGTMADWTRAIREEFRGKYKSEILEDKMFFIHSTTEVAKTSSLMTAYMNSKFFTRDRNWEGMAKNLKKLNRQNVISRENDDTKLLHKFIFYFMASAKAFQVYDGIGLCHMMILFYLSVRDEGKVSRQDILKYCVPTFAKKTVIRGLGEMVNKNIIGITKKTLLSHDIAYFVLPKTWNLLGEIDKYILGQIEKS